MKIIRRSGKRTIEMGDSSMLHIIILEEMDAICKQRGAGKDGMRFACQPIIIQN